jgi:hypothetical protein
MRRTLAPASLALAASLAGAPAEATAKPPGAAQILVTRLSTAIARCWFAKGETAFAAYSYAPETDAYAGLPRILLVPKKAPHGKPALVVEIDAKPAGNDVNIYGPLMSGGLAARIQADVSRWANGGTACR